MDQSMVNGLFQAQQPYLANGSSQQHQTRPLSVNEALPYSPMTSAPIFGLDCILRPEIGRNVNTTSTNHILQAGRNISRDLDSEIRSGSIDSGRLDTSREYLQQLLDSYQLSEFKFKLPPTSKNALSSQSTVVRDHAPKLNNLGPFARMMLDSTDVAFRYPTSSVPVPGVKNEKPSDNPVSRWNDRAFLANRSLGFVKTEPENLARSDVVVPIELDPAGQPNGLPNDHGSHKKRKLEADNTTNVTAHRLKDQKEEGDAALLKLQDFLHEVFEAEDQLEPDTSAAPVIDRPNTVFTAASALEINGFILSCDSHSNLQKYISKVASFGRLQDIPSDYINRVQKLCEKPILFAQAPDLRLDEPSNESEIQAWSRKLEDMLNALYAINTLLHSMSGGQSERDLCPEGLIEAIPNVLNQVFDNCIIPAVETRPGGKDAQLFGCFTSQKQIIGHLIHRSKKVLLSLADFLSRIDVSEGAITATEFFAAKLIFVENAHTEKDSAVGYQKYQSVRHGAMDILAKIFSKYPAQRPYILDEILVSLEKLPSTRQSARQFKLADGKNIQLLTALVLQLVQTTALKSPSSRPSKAKRRLTVSNDEKEGEALADDDQTGSDDESEVSLERLATTVNRLHDNAVRSAQYIVKFIVQRAMTSSKTGDQPYRNILDLFTEDLISVLGSTDWPAAELILRILASQMVGIADLDKSPANAKSMALELLGWMGSAISDLTVTAQHLVPALEESGEDLSDYLRQLYDEYSSRSLLPQDLVVSTGPYKITLEYLLQDKGLDNWHLTSARGYYLTQWAKTVCSIYYNSENKDEVAHDVVNDDLVSLLSKLLSDSQSLETNRSFQNVSTAHGRFAYILTVLNSSFCKAFDTILKVLLKSIASDQAKIRSRSLKSVIYMLEKDPNLLDRDSSVVRVILRCAADASPMVRDSALSLIAKCISLKPGLEEDGCRSILACAADPTSGVRKRCIALLKDIYLKTSREELKLAILDSLLQRTADVEESVATLARPTIEEICLTPFHGAIDATQDSPKLKVALGEQVNLLVSLVQRSETALETLCTCLGHLLSDKSKIASSNFKVCRAIVSTMFEKLVEDSDSLGKFYQQALLQTITVFAKANAKLFSPDQLETLHPYIGNLVTADDLFMFRSVVVIYRRVLPYLSSAHNTLLKEVQNDLFKSVAKLARSELNEVMACLWTINGVLRNTERLVKLTISVIKGIQASADLARTRSYIRIAGCVGRHCDLEKYEQYFKNAFPSWGGGSVAGLLADTIIPYTLSEKPFELRVMALESLGSICESWPGQFGREGPRRIISMVFEEDNPSLQHIILRSFAEFFAMHEGKSEVTVVPSAESADEENSSRFGVSMKANDNDGAAALIAQHFLHDMLRVAKSRQDTYALTAVELIASINRQGLVHPKECAGVLVALETSAVPAIAKVAFETHKLLHQQYESMFEREYMRAVQEAFHYQRDVVGDSSGALSRPFTPKLAPLFEIVKTSNSRYQRKFLSNLCSKVNFELKNLDSTGNPPDHLLLARFVLQNLAFFEYGQLAELLPTIGCMERIVAATGTVVAHSIEIDIFPPKIEPPSEGNFLGPSADPANQLAPPRQIDSGTLRLLATAAACLSMLWETRTYLRRLYGLGAHIRDKEGKTASKELSKTPSKVNGVTGDKLWDAFANNMASLDNEETMVTKCREFTTLLSIDEEFKVTEDNDADGDHLDGPADLDETVVANRPGKRKSSVSGSNPVKRPKQRRSIKPATKDSDDDRDRE